MSKIEVDEDGMVMGMELISNHVCMKKDLGIHNNLFGGFLLAWLDEAGASYATNICETPLMVTI